MGTERAPEEFAEFSLPAWSMTRCHDCDELFLPGFGSVWSSRQPDRHTHGGLHRCREQAEHASRPDVLVLQLILAHQAIVEAQEILGRFVSTADDAHWDDETAQAVFAADASLRRGYRALAFPRDFAPVPVQETDRG